LATAAALGVLSVQQGRCADGAREQVRRAKHGKPCHGSPAAPDEEPAAQDE